MYMEVVLQQSQCREHESGLRVPAYKRLKQLDDSKGHLLAVRGRAGIIYNGPVCISNEYTCSFQFTPLAVAVNALAIT